MKRERSRAKKAELASITISRPVVLKISRTAKPKDSKKGCR